MAMSVNSKNVFKFLQEAEAAGQKYTANQIAEKLGLSSKTVNACFTASIQRKDMGYREVKVIEVDPEEGITVEKKYLRLNDEGKAFDLDAPTDAE